MMEHRCLNFGCPAHPNGYTCPCVVCPNRVTQNFSVTSNRTLTEEETMDMDFIDRAARQMLSNQLIIMGALDDLIMHGDGNQWAIVHPAATALHDGMAATSDILAQSVEPPKEGA